MSQVGRYSVVVTGLLCTPEEFRTRALKLGVKDDHARKILSTLPCRVKMNQALANAKKYEQAFQQLGAIVEVRPEWDAQDAATMLGIGPKGSPAKPRSAALGSGLDHAVLEMPAVAPLVAVAAPRAPALALDADGSAGDLPDVAEGALEIEPGSHSEAVAVRDVVHVPRETQAIELESAADSAASAFSAPSVDGGIGLGVDGGAGRGLAAALRDESPLELDVTAAPAAAAKPQAAATQDLSLDVAMNAPAAKMLPKTPAAATGVHVAGGGTRPMFPGGHRKLVNTWREKDWGPAIKGVVAAGGVFLVVAILYSVSAMKAHGKVYDFEKSIGPKLAGELVRLQAGEHAVTREEIEATVVELARKDGVRILPDEIEVVIHPSELKSACAGLDAAAEEARDGGPAVPPGCVPTGMPRGLENAPVLMKMRIEAKIAEMVNAGAFPRFVVGFRAYVSGSWGMKRTGWNVEYMTLAAFAEPS